MSEVAGEIDPSRVATERARLLIEAGRPAEALPLLHQAIRSDPQDGEPRCLLAYAHYRQGAWREALKSAEDAASYNSQEEWCHRLRALALLELKQNWKALLAAQESARLDPQGRYALKVLSRCQLMNGKRREARQSAQQLLEVAPNWADSHECLGYVALTEQKWKEAEQHYRSALRINPQSWNALNDLALCVQRQGRHKEAVELFHQAAQLQPGEQLARQNLYSSVQGYVGGGFVVLWVMLQLVRVLIGATDKVPPAYQIWIWIAMALVIGVVVFGLLRYRRRRLAEIHPTVVAYYEDETRRASRRRLEKLGVFGGLAVGTFISLFWGIVVLSLGSEASLSGPGAIFLTFIAAATVAGYIVAFRYRDKLTERWKS